MGPTPKVREAKGGGKGNRRGRERKGRGGRGKREEGERKGRGERVRRARVGIGPPEGLIQH